MAFRVSIAGIAVIAVIALLFPPIIPVSDQSRNSENIVVEESNPASRSDQSKVLPDAEFERFVNLQTIALAWERRDSMMMTDITLQLFEGERVLRRPHPVVTSAEALSVAVWLTTENNDEVSQRRLTMAAKQFGHNIVDERELSPDLIRKIDLLVADAGSP